MLVRRVARPLLSSVFIFGGLDAIRRPSGRAEVGEPVIDLIDQAVVQPAAKRVAVGAAGLADEVSAATADIAEEVSDPDLHTQATVAHDTEADASATLRRVSIGGLDLADETYVRINGAVQVAAGLLLATGRAPRLASTALAASIVPTTIAGHRFWEYEGEERHLQRMHFVKNASLLGGLILAAVDTEGRPGLAWRARHLRGGGGVVAAAAAADARLATKAAKADAKAARRLAAANATVAKANAKAAGAGAKVGVEIAHEQAVRGWRSARKHARRAAVESAPARHEVAERAIALGQRAQERATGLTPQVHAIGAQAQQLASDLVPQVQAVGQRVAEALPRS